jgi:hypothetical protein
MSMSINADTSLTVPTCGVRRSRFATSILRKSRPGVRLNEPMEHTEGAVVFQPACKMGLEGIVSKRLGSRYRSGRSPDWLKFKNPAAPAWRVRRKRTGIADPRRSRWLCGLQGPITESLRVALASVCKVDNLLWATASRVGVAAPSVRSSATRANSYASPMTRIVSGSNLWPWRWDRIGTCISCYRRERDRTLKPPTPGAGPRSVIATVHAVCREKSLEDHLRLPISKDRQAE